MVIRRLWPGAWCLDQKRRVWVVPGVTFMAVKTWRWVLVNERLVWGLTEAQLRALIAHELGHSWYHQLCRAVVKSLAPALLPALCWRQELQADDHAKRQGLGQPLAQVLLKFQDLPQNGDYPPIAERVRRLTC